jgi:hypothetical protein
MCVYINDTSFEYECYGTETQFLYPWVFIRVVIVVHKIKLFVDILMSKVGRTALVIAATVGHFHIIKILLEHHAHMEATDEV